MTVFHDREIFDILCDEFVGCWVWVIFRTNKGRFKSEAFGKIFSITAVPSGGVADILDDLDPSHYDYYKLMIENPIEVTDSGGIPYDTIYIYRHEKNTDFRVLSTVEVVTYQLTKQKVDMNRISA